MMALSKDQKITVGIGAGVVVALGLLWKKALGPSKQVRG